MACVKARKECIRFSENNFVVLSTGWCVQSIVHALDANLCVWGTDFAWSTVLGCVLAINMKLDKKVVLYFVVQHFVCNIVQLFLYIYLQILNGF